MRRAGASTTSQRNSRASPPEQLSSDLGSDSGREKSPMHSPLLPTPTESILLAIFPLTLFLGAAFSHLSPLLRPPYTQAVYSATHQSFQPPELAPSYFATKRNVFNVFFVKIGWFWSTLAFAAWMLLGSRASRIRFGSFAQPEESPSSVAGERASPSKIRTRSSVRAESLESTEAGARLRRRYQATIRYFLCTAAWFLATQWFFGPPVVDRLFSLSGGACQIDAELRSKASDETKDKVAQAFSHAACKLAGGRWQGGYDVSGHVFLLVLGSGMLWAEMLPVIFDKWWGVAGGRLILPYSASSAPGGNGFPVPIAHEKESAVAAATVPPHAHSPLTMMQKVRAWAISLSLGVSVLSWWMLLMTSAFFHTWSEKTVALVLATAVLWGVYLLPRGIPAIRSIVGMPGI